MLYPIVVNYVLDLFNLFFFAMKDIEKEENRPYW